MPAKKAAKKAVKKAIKDYFAWALVSKNGRIRILYMRRKELSAVCSSDETVRRVRMIEVK